MATFSKLISHTKLKNVIKVARTKTIASFSSLKEVSRVWNRLFLCFFILTKRALGITIVSLKCSIVLSLFWKPTVLQAIRLLVVLTCQFARHLVSAHPILNFFFCNTVVTFPTSPSTTPSPSTTLSTKTKPPSKNTPSRNTPSTPTRRKPTDPVEPPITPNEISKPTGSMTTQVRLENNGEIRSTEIVFSSLNP